MQIQGRPLFQVLLISALGGCRTPSDEARPENFTVTPPPQDSAEVPQGGQPGDDLVGPVHQSSSWWSNLNPDSLHRQLSTTAQLTGNKIDEFLSNRRSTSEENRSWFQFEVSGLYEEREGLEPRARVRGTLALPHSQDRLQLVLGGDDDSSDGEEIDELVGPGSDLEGETGDGASIALKYFLRATRSNNASFSGGVRFNGIEPDPYVSLRWRYLDDFDWFSLRATEKLRYYLLDGGESRTILDLERGLSKDYFLRLTGTGNWAETAAGFDYGTFARLYHQLDPKNLLTYEVGSNFTTRPENATTSIYTRLRFRHLFSRDWILVELAPQIAWRQADDYDPALGLLLSFKFTFRATDLKESSSDH